MVGCVEGGKHVHGSSRKPHKPRCWTRPLVHNAGMSHHSTRLLWTRNTDQPFTYDTYTRDHQITMESGLAFAASAAPEYKGNAKLANPEEMLVAALSSCHMLTFLAVCAKKGFVVSRYEDDAVGTLAKPDTGPIQVTTCVLKPRAEFEGTAPDAETLHKLHEQAHRGCFIANSVKTIVTFELA
jgi:organic hydroperoxide reductase OsmC/OhrA